MNHQRLSKVKIAVAGLTMAGLIFLSGCKGDTGPAGPAGTPATFGNVSCTDCHHLNNTPITPSSQIFVDGLAGPDRTISAGSSTTLNADVSKLPAGETAVSYLWTEVAGLATELSSTLASSLTVTVPPQASNYDYKQAVVNNVPSAGLITSDTGSVLRDATMIVPISSDALDLASGAEFQLTVFTASGKSYYDIVTVFDQTAKTFLAGAAAVNTGLQTVPANVPVLLKAKTAGTYAWSVTGPAPVTVNDSTLQIADFTPTTPGTYTVSVNGTTFPVYAGTWRGEAVGVDGNNDLVPDTNCTVCHNNTIAIDKFTPWKSTGHAHIFSKNLNNGVHFSTICFQCHTVGFNTNPNAINNGFDDQPNYAAFITDPSMISATPDASRYQRMWANPAYVDLAKETNVQCENCHGPQASGAGFIASHSTTTSSSVGGPRTSMAADVCGSCHGEPLRHSRFQQWQQSGHGQYDLAIGEGTLEENDPGAAACAGCHTAQGSLILQKSLLSGRPLRTLPNGTNDITWTADTVQPVTCQVCHDPHAEGTTSGVPNTATVRISENTPKLPGGFMATGVGRGAMCITCHNSRNGTPSATNEPSKNVAPFNRDSFLHQDGDPVFGSLTAYAAPHIASQGDVLMGHNAYFVGNGDMRSPHSLIPDTCPNCHMERTPPPPLLSYNLSGTNHTFRASLDICAVCHGVNQGLGPMLQKSVQAELGLLQSTIVDVIISRNTGTRMITDATTLTTNRGVPAANLVFDDGSTALMNIGDIPGLCVTGTGCLGTDVLAKAIWNYFLIQQDSSLGVHNPDFTFLVLGETRFQTTTIMEP